MPELSIVIPILNEQKSLAEVFAQVNRQQGVDAEVVLVDGGSADRSLEIATSLAQEAAVPCRVFSSSAGRGRQLNLGATQAGGDYLLFLHADSRFADPLALQKGLKALRRAEMPDPERFWAGRFQLSFRCPQPDLKQRLYFWEWKARLSRAECIHGDQGFLMSRRTFRQVGPFEENVPLAEDTRLAERLRHRGHWLLLPAEIATSARRFAREGLAERQTLNALLMNFLAIGWEDFFQHAGEIYRSQDRARMLELLPYWELIRSLLRKTSWRQGFELWYRTGCYVRRQAWQIPFALDVRRARRTGVPVGEGLCPHLARHDRWFDRLTDHPPGRLAAAALTWAWFTLKYWHLVRASVPKESKEV